MTSLKTIVGVGSSFLAVITSSQENISWTIMLIVGLLSGISIAFDIRRKWKNRNK